MVLKQTVRKNTNDVRKESARSFTEKRRFEV